MDFIKTYMKLDDYTKKLVDSIHRKSKVKQRYQLEEIKRNMERRKIKKFYINEFIETIRVVCDI